MKLIIILVLLCISILELHTQNDTNLIIKGSNKYYFSVAGGLSDVFNQTKLPIIPGADDCGTFSDGEDYGYYAGIRFGYDILEKFLTAELGLIYENRPVSLQKTTSSYQILSPITNKYENFVRLHEYQGSLQYVDFEVAFKVQPLKDYPFQIKIAFGIGNPLGGTDFNNYEQIVSPSGVLFPDQTLRRMVAGGKIESAGTNMGAISGLSYDFHLKNNLVVSPEIQYRYGMNSVLSDAEWHTDIFRAGISIAYRFGQEVIKPVIKKVDTIIPEPKPEPIIVKVEEKKPLKRIDSLVINKIEIEQTTVTQTFPILPYIFFDSASSEIKPIYLKNSNNDSFSEAGLPQDNVEIYYRILDLIGSRMNSNKKANLIINGVTDGAELSNTTLRLKLGMNRAEIIKQYLIDNWKIEENRIITKSQELPNLATSTQYKEGFAENRRVEFSSNNSELFEPVSHTKFLEFATTNDKIQISPKLNNQNDIKHWTMHLSADDRIIYNTRGDKPFELNEIQLDSKLINQIGNSTAKNKLVKVVFQIIDGENNVESSEYQIPVNLKSQNFELGRLNLIVFDFDRSDLSKFNQNLISKFVESSIKPESTVNIIGSTDKLGEIDYNFQLSKSRAENVNAFIRNKMPGVNIQKIEGIGSSLLKYNNDLPEGRFYCRTVLIEVKTPLEKR